MPLIKNMLNFSEIKKIIFSLFLGLFIVFISYFGSKLYLEPEITKEIKEKLENSLQLVNKKSLIFAQESIPYFIPRYPYRLKYLTEEIFSASERFVFLNEDLERSLKNCDCSQAQSQCIRKPARAWGISRGLSSLLAKENKAFPQITLASKFEEELKKMPGAWEKEFEKVSPEGTIRYLEDSLKNLREELLPDLNKELDKLSPEVRGDLKEKVGNLKGWTKELEETLKNPTNETGEELKGELEKFKEHFQKLDGELKNIALAEIRKLQEGLKGKFNEIVDSFEGLFGALSMCVPGPIGAFGDPCGDIRVEIRKIQTEVQSNVRYLSYLRELLKKEMAEEGFKRELESLDPEEAQELKINLEKLLTEGESLIKKAENSANLPEDCLARNCGAVCQAGYFFSLKACLAAGTGEQKPIVLRFKGKVSLKDLELGKVGIKNINLGLPETIELPSIGDISSFTIPGPGVAVSFPETSLAELPHFEPRPIRFQIPQLPSLPRAPEISLACPNIPSPQPFNWGIADDKKEVGDLENVEISWYFQAFSWLSEKCQELSGMKDAKGIPTTKTEGCFNPGRVITTVVQECNTLWQGHCLSPETELPQICQKIRKSCADKDGKVAAADRCQDLFRKEGKPIPLSCSYSIDPEGNYFFPPDFNPLRTLQKECADLKKNNRKEAPEPCKLLPLFTGHLPLSDPLVYSGQRLVSPPQKMIDNPSNLTGCPIFPSLPKITFPKIVIPDIQMPGFYLPPFICVKLPNFIFEDLILPDINLCNFDECQNIFPSLNFRLPMIQIPKIDIPAITLPDIEIDGLRIPLPNLEIDPIRFPAIPFLGLQFPNLGDLIMPEFLLPSIPLPQPKISLSFEGIDLSAITALIQTFILNAMGIPNYGLCIGFDLKSIPCCISFPDYVFSWPAFPRIPEINFCKDVNKFCSEIRSYLEVDVFGKVRRIESTFNRFVDREIQAKLDKVALEVSREIQRMIEREVNQRAEELGNKLTSHIKENIQRIKDECEIRGIPPELCKMKIPPYREKLPDIPIPGISLSEKLNLPEEIPIPWPDELKKITLKREISYQLPTIPLGEKLSYEKEFEIKLPGFQTRDLTVDLGLPFLGNVECKAMPPSGGNPCPTKKFQGNFAELKKSNSQIEEAFQRVIKVLE